MRKIIYGIFLFAGLLASSLGFGKQEVQAAPVQGIRPALDNACDEGLVFSDVLNMHEGTLVASHYSHRSHVSHTSHTSHRSHYSSRY